MSIFKAISSQHFKSLSALRWFGSDVSHSGVCCSINLASLNFIALVISTFFMCDIGWNLAYFHLKAGKSNRSNGTSTFSSWTNVQMLTMPAHSCTTNTLYISTNVSYFTVYFKKLLRWNKKVTLFYRDFRSKTAIIFLAKCSLNFCSQNIL